MTRLERTFSGRNALLNCFELWVAVAAIISGIVYFIDSAALDGNSVSKQVGYHMAFLWNVSYFVSGIGVAWGLLKPSPRIEIAALSILGAATAINGVSIFAVYDTRGAATAITLLTLTLAACVRCVIVYRAVNKYAEIANDHCRRS